MVERVFLVARALQSFGGMEQSMTDLALGLLARGVAVEVFSREGIFRRNQYLRRLRAEGVPVHAPGHHPWLRRLPRVMPRPDAAAGLQQRLERALATGKRPVVHVHGYRLDGAGLGRWATARGMATVYTEHSTIAEVGPVDGADISGLGAFRAYTTVSEASRAALLRLLPPGREVTVVPNIVAGEALPPARPGEVFELLCVARLHPVKGVDVLLHAIALLVRDSVRVRLTIIGQGEARAELEALARELDVAGSVRFLGRIDHAALGAFYVACQAFVLPSRSEALASALLEAMAAGRPVIASAVGGIPGAVRAGVDGLLVPPEDAEALAAAIASLAQDRERLLSLGRAARVRFEDLGLGAESHVEAMLAVYREAEGVVGSRPPGGAL